MNCKHARYIWDFRVYVLNMLFYRYLSEKMSNILKEYLPNYADLSDEEAKAEIDEGYFIKNEGFFIPPTNYFVMLLKHLVKIAQIHK